ncbi:enoyl-CoA hydratase [Dietzia sp. HMSC21D01]|uniref:enoyl-CoA hydratase/isomerase family protein n=1 Tax=Dietzia TaxID=37914 RepID=UPI0008A63162|nr:MULTISPECIES: enoyl-CoA hydratase/isomerase family protein [Dietzia]MCT2107438.1 enoyl-CoA hydratase/isomerase family protein [Dietzia cinnamea]OFS29564.1 enoyl-CoA hydratase [Dietzia sp. HMSC21D01]PZT86977.1 MAG: enoyl-CoA hydratase/isomerase family protein [Gordonia sp. (in: high G+C Gram-positive bacteria)]
MTVNLGNITTAEKDGVFTIEVGRLDDATHEGLAKVFRLAHESDADVVVLTGKDRSFLNPMNYDIEWVKHLAIYKDMLKIFKEAEDIVRDIVNCEKPTIAKVYAPGAHSLGASLALACDFVVAADDASFSDPHLSGFGVVPGDGGSLVWPTRIGLGRAREFLMLDKVASAQEALEIGLINRAVPADDVDAEVDKIIAKLQSYDQVGVKFTKRWLNQYMRQNMNIAGMGSLYAEGMVFSHDEFAKKVDEYTAMLAKQGGYSES